MPPRDINIEPPLAGLDESAPHQSQPPYTTPRALNVRPYDTIGARSRIGVRPGLSLSRVWIGAGGPAQSIGGEVQCISDIDFSAATSVAFGSRIINVDTWKDDFEGDALGEGWVALRDVSGVAYDFPNLFERGLCCNSSSTYLGCATTKPNLNTDNDPETSPYSAWITIVPWAGAFSGTYRIIANMSAATPSMANCVVATITMAANGSYSGTVITYVAGVASETDTFSSSTGNGIQPCRFMLRLVSGDFTAWLNETTLNNGVRWSDDTAYTAFGFALKYDGSADGGRACVSQFGAHFDSSTDRRESYKSRVFIANQKVAYEYPLYYGQLYGTTTSTIPATGPLQAVSYNQITYVASGGDIVEQGSGVVTTNGANALFLTADDTTINFSAAPYSFPDSGTYSPPVLSCELVQADKGVRLGPYRIISYFDATHKYKLNIKGWVPETPPVAGWACRWRIVKSHVKFDPKSRTVSNWYATDNATYTNVVPNGCRLIARYYDRVVLAGSPQHLMFASRMGDPLDFYFGDTDVAGAYATQFSEAGEIGETITALIPFGMDYMVVGCTDSIWKLVGDLNSGGTMVNITRATGIATGTSWCRTPDGSLVFVGREGLFLLPAGATQTPIPLSDKVPARLRQCIQNGSRLALAYDHRGTGIWIFHTQDDVTKRTHWWYCWKHKSFWPVSLPDGFEPTALGYDEDRRVLLGGRDGVIRVVDEQSPTDCGEDIYSYVKIGPFRNSTPRRRLRMGVLNAVVPDDSGPVRWYVQQSNSGELAIDADPQRGGTWNAGLNATTDPRVGGGAVVLHVGNSDAITDHDGREILDSEEQPILDGGFDQQWTVEQITARISDGGELRA